jgi:pimeloyl-ACP methyl ester carboxylesterase
LENNGLPFLSTIVDGETGHPALLIHDLNASLNDWEALIPALVDAGYVTYACDLFGHGHSPHPPDPGQYHAQLHLAALRRWVDDLKLVRAPILIGHGFGAYLCLRYTLGHPYRVFKLVLINPLLTPEQIAPVVRALGRHAWLEKLAMLLAPNWTERKMLGIHPGCRPELVQRIMADAKRGSPYNQRILTGIADLNAELDSLPTRSLFILGLDDPLLDMDTIRERVEDHIDFTCLSMPGLGHRPQLEAPDETNKLIVNFLLGI